MMYFLMTRNFQTERNAFTGSPKRLLNHVQVYVNLLKDGTTSGKNVKLISNYF